MWRGWLAFHTDWDWENDQGGCNWGKYFPLEGSGLNSNEWTSKRLVVDVSRKINRFTRLDVYLLPRMDDLTQEIAKYKIYCSLDLKGVYHQIPIKEDQPYKAFEANGKFYQFCRIPFGVSNGVACFQRIIDKIIKENNLTDVYAYVDNIVVVGKNQQEHDGN